MAQVVSYGNNTVKCSGCNSLIKYSMGEINSKITSSHIRSGTYRNFIVENTSFYIVCPACHKNIHLRSETNERFATSVDYQYD